MLVAKFPYRRDGKWYHGQLRFSSYEVTHLPGPNAVKNAIVAAYPTAFIEHTKFSYGKVKLEERNENEWNFMKEGI